MREVLNIVSGRLMNFIKSAPIIDRKYRESNHGDLSIMTGQAGALYALYRYVMLLRKETKDGWSLDSLKEATGILFAGCKAA